MLPEPETRYIGTHWGTYRAAYEDGKLTALVPIEADPDPSAIAGGMVDALEAASRIRRPSLRRGFLERVQKGLSAETTPNRRGAEPFVELPWDEALDIAATEIARIRKMHGNGAIYGGSYGWASAGRFHHAQSQLHRFLNCIGGYVKSVQNYSYAAADVIVPHVIGSKEGLVSGHTSWPRIADKTETLVLFGGLPRKNAQVSSGGISRHILTENLDRLAARGARIISVSPLRDDTVAQGVEWLAIRPNTDTALMLGIAHSLLTRNLHDASFLDRYTSGFERLEAYIRGRSDGVEKSPDWAAGITGIGADTIRDLADALSGSRSFIMVAWALQRAQHGEQPYWMAIALAAMVGQIGLPGGGFGFGYGSVNGIGNPSRATRFPALGQFDNAVSDYIPVARIADCLLHPGESYDYNGQHRTYPDLRMVYWAGGNPFHHHQDLNRLRDAWQKPELVMVNESWWTPTARHADIVFPVATALERNDIVCSNRDRFLTPSHQLREPFGDARTDFDVLRALAGRLDCEPRFSEDRDEETWLRTMYDEARSRNTAGLDLPDFESFWTGGPLIFDPDDGEVERDMMSAFRADPQAKPLGTPSGRIELYSDTIAGFDYADCPAHPSWLPPDEWLGAKAAKTWPLHLISNQPKTRLHSQYDPGAHSRAAKIEGRETLRMAPADADARGLKDGAIVSVRNDRGTCLAALVISDDVRPGVVQLSTGAWFDPDNTTDARPLERHGNPNVLTRDIGTSRLAQGPAAMSCLVEVAGFDGPLPRITVFEQPENIEQGKEKEQI